MLELEGKPVVDLTIRPQGDGSILLRASDAIITGNSPAYESGGGKDQIGFWRDAKDYVSWEFQANKAGAYEVEVAYSASAGAGGSEYTLSMGTQTLAGKSEASGDWAAYRTDKLGKLTIDQPGKVTLTFKPKTPPAWKSMGLKSVVLKPAK